MIPLKHFKHFKHLFRGFTLVELIVVISVLAVLATIAMSQVSNITAWARDSQRMTDMLSMKSSIELYKAKTGKLPIPTNGSGVTYSGGLLWTQGIFGESVTREIKSITPKPIDPINKIEYVYSVANNNREFELGGILEKATSFNHKTRGAVIPREHPLVRPSESLGGRVIWLANELLSDQVGYLGSQFNHLPWDSIILNPSKLTNQGIPTVEGNHSPSEWQYSLFSSQDSFSSPFEMIDLGFDETLAASQNVTFIEGTYNGISLKVETGSKVYVVAAPSLIGGYLGDAKMENAGLTIEGLGSLPLGFSGTATSTANTGTFTPVVAWIGSSFSSLNSTQVTSLVTWLKSAYAGKNAADLPQISGLLALSGANQEYTYGKWLVTNALGGTLQSDSLAGALNCANPTVTTIAGSSPTSATGFVDGVGTAARFYYPYGITMDAVGNAYIADTGNAAVRKMAPDGTVTTIAGSYPSYATGLLDGVGTAARFWGPIALNMSSEGVLYISDINNNAIRKMAPDGTVTTIAGAYPTPTIGFLDGMGTLSRLYRPWGLSFDSQKSLFIVDEYNHAIRKMTPDGNVVTFAGAYPTKTPGFLDGTGTAARFNTPIEMTRDSFDNLYVSDYVNHAIRKITPAGVVTTIAGSYPTATSGLLDGTGTGARFYYPRALALDQVGNMFIADYFNHAIRKMTPDGVVTTIAGAYPTPTPGFIDGVGTSARLNYPQGIAIDGAWNLIVVEYGNHAIRKISCQ